MVNQIFLLMIFGVFSQIIAMSSSLAPPSSTIPPSSTAITFPAVVHPLQLAPQEPQKPLTSVEAQLLYENLSDVAKSINCLKDSLSLEIESLNPQHLDAEKATINDSLTLIKKIKDIVDNLCEKSSQNSKEIVISVGGID